MPTVMVDQPSEGVGRITLDRPQVLNAINRDLLDDFQHAAERLEHDPETRAVILRGAGRAFSAGFDLKAEAAEGPQPAEVWVDRFVEDWEVFLNIWNSAKPYVAAVRGYNLGGALELSLLCDVTIAASGTMFGLPEIRHAGGPGATMLPWVLGMKPAKWLMLSGESIDAEEARRLGMVTEVVADEDLDAAAIRVAAKLAALPPMAVKLTKLALNRTYERMGLLGAVKENYMISTVMNATAVYRAEERQRQDIPLKEFLRQRDTPSA
ncbi:MAG: enoyl-CoA hydratase/isomerase family protein [Acidimicrobiales bacterium]